MRDLCHAKLRACKRLASRSRFAASAEVARCRPESEKPTFCSGHKSSAAQTPSGNEPVSHKPFTRREPGLSLNLQRLGCHGHRCGGMGQVATFAGTQKVVSSGPGQSDFCGFACGIRVLERSQLAMLQRFRPPGILFFLGEVSPHRGLHPTRRRIFGD